MLNFFPDTKSSILGHSNHASLISEIIWQRRENRKVQPKIEHKQMLETVLEKISSLRG